MSESMLEGHRVLGFDLETTGFDPRTDRVVEYAFVGSEPDGEHVSLNSLVHPGVKIPEESIRVHGISDEDVRGKGGFAEHAGEVCAAIAGAVIVGHNVIAFDWKFIEMEFMRMGAEAPRPHAIIDTLVIARRFGIPGKHKLGALCDRFGIGLENSHRANVDAGATLLLLWKVMRAYPSRFNGTLEDFLQSLAS